MFVTTGRISPQAKREYLDNYPNFELTFLDGVNLVDQVLSSPILSAVWFDGGSIIQSRHSLLIPFIMRKVIDDQPVRIEPFPDCNSNGIDFNFRNSYIDRARLEPYRSPINIQDNEYNSRFVDGQYVYCIGSTCLYDIPTYRDLILKKISKIITKDYLPLTIRFGTPSFVTNNEALKEQSGDGEDYVVIPKVKPISYVIGSEGDIVDERSWVVLSNSDFWVFPENLSVAEADWAGWLNQKDNTICMQQIESPTDDPYFIDILFKNLNKDWLYQSLFTLAKQNEYDNLLASLSDDEHPNYIIDCGFGLLVCWVHPFYGKFEGLKITHNNETEKYEASSEEDFGQDQFPDYIIKIKNKLESFGLIPTSPDKAILLAQIADSPLLRDSSYQEYRSAKLFHYFDEIPSPIYHLKCKLIFVRMWEVPVSPQEARDAISNNPFNFNESINIFWQAKSGPKTEKTFLMSSLIFNCPPDISCDKYFKLIGNIRDEQLNCISNYVYSIWKDAKLSTVYFWSVEVGFKIGDGIFEGNPFIVFFNNDSSNDLKEKK